MPKLTRIFLLTLLGSLEILLAAPGYGQLARSSDQQGDRDIRQSLEKIAKVYQYTATQAAEPVDPEKTLYDGAIRGALSTLDPFSTFLDADQTRSLEQQARGVQQGFGAILNVQAGRVIVLQSVPGSPFARVGIGPGDRIVRINGHRVAALDLQELVEILQQARSSRVHLAVLQTGKAVATDFDLDPAEVPTPTVDKKFLLQPDIGYLHVARVEESTPGEIKAALETWTTRHLRGVVMDLRDNPGGLLEPAVGAVSLFLQERQPVVSLHGRAMPEKKYVVDAAPLWKDIPLVVLINERTASAAEIIAAAFQDHDRAWIVGQASFGKGVVESVLPLSEGTSLALTVARYFTPQGRSVQRSLPGTALADISGGSGKKFHTDGGRPLAQTGGVQPDHKADSWRLDPWAQLLAQTTVFLNFAQSYLDRGGKVTESFAVEDSILNEFRSYLREAGAVVPPDSWSASLPFLKIRIKTELFNLVFGASKGDEVEIGGDPQVERAVQDLGQAEQLLRLTQQSHTGAVARP